MRKAHHRIGGLEESAWEAYQSHIVHHRIGGLEGNIQLEQQRQTVHHRTGGLEVDRSFCTNAR